MKKVLSTDNTYILQKKMYILINHKMYILYTTKYVLYKTLNFGENSKKRQIYTFSMNNLFPCITFLS